MHNWMPTAVGRSSGSLPIGSGLYIRAGTCIPLTLP